MPRNVDLETVFLPAWQEMCYKYNIPYDYKTTQSTKKIVLHFKNSRPTEILLKHLSKPEEIVGVEIAWFIVDELDVLPYVKAKLAWKNLLGRMRVGNYRQGCACTTPEGFKFTYERWEEKGNFDYKIIKMKTTDNPYLPKDYLENLTNNYTEKQRQAYIDGDFVNLEGATVWINFDREKHVKNFQVEYGRHKEISGWDFGFDHPTTVVIGYYNQYEDVLYIVDEICVRNNSIDTTILEYKKKIKEHSLNVREEFCDPAGNQRSEDAPRTNIQTMLDMGLNPRYRSSYISDGVTIGNNLFEKMRVVINPRCRNLISSLEKWSRIIDKNGVSSGYEEQYKDMSDAFRYLIYNLFVNRYFKMNNRKN